MANDSSQVSQLITEFRAIKTQDSITPDSLGALLQRIADVTAAANESVDKLAERLDNLPVVSGDGSSSGLTAGDLNKINQLAEESKGLSRELFNLKSSLKAGSNLQNQIVVSPTKISCYVKEEFIYVSGADKLIEEGFVPYLFRFTKKRNQFRHKPKYANYNPNRKFCDIVKGWNLFGSRHAVCIIDNILQFSLNSRDKLHCEAWEYDPCIETLVHTHHNDKGEIIVPWGKRTISSIDFRTDENKHRMLRLRYALAFGRPMDMGSHKITPDMMVTPLAEFSAVFDPVICEWRFSK